MSAFLRILIYILLRIPVSLIYMNHGRQEKLYNQIAENKDMEDETGMFVLGRVHAPPPPPQHFCVKGKEGKGLKGEC